MGSQRVRQYSAAELNWTEFVSRAVLSRRAFWWKCRILPLSSIVAICCLKQHRPRAPMLPRRWKHNQCWANLVKVRISRSVQWGPILSLCHWLHLSLTRLLGGLWLCLPTVICWDVWVLSWSLVVGLLVDCRFYFAGWTQKYYLWPCGVCGYVCNVWICICSNIWEYLILLQKKKWDNTVFKCVTYRKLC